MIKIEQNNNHHEENNDTDSHPTDDTLGIKFMKIAIGFGM